MGKERDWQKAVRGILLAAAVGLLVMGICTGGPVEVKSKAVRICLECIGIG